MPHGFKFLHRRRMMLLAEFTNSNIKLNVKIDSSVTIVKNDTSRTFKAHMTLLIFSVFIFIKNYLSKFLASTQIKANFVEHFLLVIFVLVLT